MKKLMMIVALFMGATTFAIAQDAKKDRAAHKTMTPEQRAEKQTNRMQQALQLTDAQKTAIYDLNLQSAKEMQAARGEARGANKEKFKAMNKNKEEKMKGILSADQFAKYQQMKAERMKKMQERKAAGKGRAGAPTEAKPVR